MPLNPDEAVALGAAIQGVLCREGEGRPTLALPDGVELSVSDVTSQSLGVIALDPDTLESTNLVLIARNTKIPSHGVRVLETLEEQQSRLRVRVTQGEGEDVDFVTDVGGKTLKIPPYPKGAPFKVTYSYDVDQMIHVEVFDLTDNSSIGSFEVDNSANLSRADVAVARHRLSGTEVL